MVDRRRGRRRRRLPRRRRAGRRLTRHARSPRWRRGRDRGGDGAGRTRPSPTPRCGRSGAASPSASASSSPIVDPPELAALALRPPRIEPPGALADRCSTAPYDRAGHTYGKSFRDLVRARPRRPAPSRPTSSPSRDRRPTSSPCSTGARRRTSRRSPTAAARPSSAGSRATSATASPASCRSTSPASSGSSRSTPVSRAARIQAGALGPVLEDQLRPHGYTLRHFPQSFELSTLGGWLATRSGGHYASVYTHIDDLVESMRVVTPTGISESRRLPGSGAGPVPGPPVPRLRGQPRRSSPRRGCASRTGRGGGRRPGSSSTATPTGWRRPARARPVGAVPDQLPPARRRRGRASPPGRRASGRCSCSASSRPTIRSTRGSSGRSSSAATTAARSRPASARPTSAGRRPALARRLGRRRGGRRSCARPTCATPSCAAA